MGTGKEVVDRIRHLAQQLNVEEVAVVTWAHNDEARRISYEEIANACNM